MAEGIDRTTKPASLFHALRRGYFPHQLAWFLDNPLRNLLISPEKLAARLPIRPASRILEVGPGSGFFSRRLATLVPDGHLELLDLQPEMLAKAMARFGAPPPARVGWTAADASKPLPFADGEFDIVLLVAVLGELPDPEIALQSFRRVLRPGGTLAVHEHVPDPDLIRPAALRSLVERQGFGWQSRRGPWWNYTALFKAPAAPGS